MIPELQDVKSCRLRITCDKCGAVREFRSNYCFTEEEAFEKAMKLAKVAKWKATKDIFTKDLCPGCRGR